MLLLHLPVGGVEPELDEDEQAVRDYAKRNPLEDADEADEPEQPVQSEAGGVVVKVSDDVQAQQQEQQPQPMDEEAQVARDKRLPGDVKLPIPVRQRVAQAEASKRAQQSEGGQQAKFVRFDPDSEIVASSPKQARITLYSPIRLRVRCRIVLQSHQHQDM